MTILVGGVDAKTRCSLVENWNVSAAGPTIPTAIPSACCAIPFTLNGAVHYACTDDDRSSSSSSLVVVV